jgi:hypothetical protein
VRDIVVGDPGHPDQFPYIDSWYILAADPIDWLHFHALRRHTAILVNGKVTEKKFEVYYTSEPEPPDLSPYVPLVHLVTLASPRPGSNSEDPNRKKEASEPNPHPCHPMAPSLYPPVPLMALENEPLGKVTKFWEANKQGGRNPGCGAMPPAPGSGPPLPQADGSFVAGPTLNWQQHTPAHSEEPQAVIELLTNIMHSHQPNWVDGRQLTSTLFTSDEHR